ncbi:Hypothetical predicted protein [Mytilus galloprovincialis]|uniref:Uncharacterized protein n=1 Tax=Mytilus galloprovincialis TaxID=29158 RepID=A0A8B6HPC0_MYTGA|nr:Hypothetical predicted protein [Mytilus galloprovincialis]
MPRIYCPVSNLVFLYITQDLVYLQIPKNLKSAIERPDILLQKIKKEIDAGRVAGPFKFRPIPTLRISPLGLVPKGKDGQFRVIHHLSYPENSSVNDFIDPKKCSVVYSNIDDAVDVIKLYGNKH